MTDNTEALEGEQSLAHLLEFLSKLMDNVEVKKKVIEEIEKKAKGYVKDVEQKFGSPSSGYLYKTIENSKELRRNIVASEQNYKYYKSQFNEYNHDYAKHLINNIFSLFGCLYYMYYECAGDCDFIEGGKWQSEQCDGRSGEKYLNQWLQDKTGKAERMIKRGFKQDELSTKTGNDLFPIRHSFTDALLYYVQGAQLQFALYYMLFLPTSDKWNRGQSGHAVLFLEEFCKMASENTFNSQYTAADEGQGFKTACRSVADKISTLTILSIIVPVAVTCDLNYKDLLEVTHFWDYVKWLKDNFKNLIESLKEMENDATNWKDKESLRTSKSFGPYPWGFTFKDQNWTSGALTSNPQPRLQGLHRALETFQNALEKIEHIPSSSTASTVGGVAVGLGAAGAAGAAAYSGLLGPAAEAIGRFFKGLVL